MQQIISAHVLLLAGLITLPCVQCLVVRHNSSGSCPGVGSVCSGHGECAETTGVCWCKLGWGGTDCANEVSETYDIGEVADPQYQDLVGKYVRVPMYMQEAPGDPQNIKYIAYDQVSGGWVIGRLNSSCTDDICFFAYSKGQPVPPPKGYVYGQPDKHVYYKQLIFDDAQMYPGKEAGYHMSVAYSPDPNTVQSTEMLSEFTGRYILQPRYVHQKSGKYTIMPVSLNSPGKVWVIAGLEGVGPARHWNILAQTTDPSLNRYTVPKGGWEPRQLSFELTATCNDHVDMEACGNLEEFCRGDGPNMDWVQACCRDTCNSCVLPSTKCSLPKTAIGGQMLLQMFNRTQ